MLDPTRTGAAAPAASPRRELLAHGPDHTDDHGAHGLASDADDVRRTKAVMGVPGPARPPVMSASVR